MGETAQDQQNAVSQNLFFCHLLFTSKYNFPSLKIESFFFVGVGCFQTTPLNRTGSIGISSFIWKN